MKMIDHRILIPASPDHVWRFVGDLRRTGEWQVNITGLSMLTQTNKPTAGTRFRLTQQRGRDQVWEITRWYDRFGYEYHIVEGSPFRENKGLLRLQETPEGTIVQWTLEYTGGGLFGGAGKAQEQTIINSLQKLYKIITRSKEVDTFQAKSLMRDDPGVEARATYRPRHPTSIPTESGEGVRVPKSPYSAPTPNKPMPAVPLDNPFAPPKPLPTAEVKKLGDTRPHPTVVEPASVPDLLEPDFLIDEPNTPFSNIPSEPLYAPPSAKPVEPVSPKPVEIPPPPPLYEPPAFLQSPPPPPPVVAESPVSTPVVVPPPPPPPLDPLPSAPISAPPPAFTPPTPIPPAPAVSVDVPPPAPVPSFVPPPPPVFMPPSLSEAEKPSATPAEPPTSLPSVKPATLSSRDKLSDTSQLSVFEIFGLPKPSQTQPMPPLNVDALNATGRITPVVDEVEPVVVPKIEAVAETPIIKSVSLARQIGSRAMARRRHHKVRSRFVD